MDEMQSVHPTHTVNADAARVTISPCRAGDYYIPARYYPQSTFLL